jgi:cephalosporin-C deacetylase
MTISVSHPFEFDPTYGMNLAKLEAVEPPEAPDGFDVFWQERYRRALAVNPMPKLDRNPLRHSRWQVFNIVYRSTHDFPIGGWLLLPKTGEIKRGLVVGHGYGGRDAPNFDIPVEETAVLFPCFRGMSRSARPPISTEAVWHVLHDIDKPERYIIGGCVEDLWVAVSALELLYPRIAGRIGYSGVSFGGGIGGLAIPWDARIDRGHLSLPTFGHQELRLTLPSVGSAASVQAYQAEHGNALPTLRLHDSAVAARRITIPMLMSVALFDPAVAPPCQFAVANALPPGKYNEKFILDAGHFDYPQQASQEGALRDRVGQFFKVP